MGQYVFVTMMLMKRTIPPQASSTLLLCPFRFQVQSAHDALLLLVTEMFQLLDWTICTGTGCDF